VGFFPGIHFTAPKTNFQDRQIEILFAIKGVLKNKRLNSLSTIFKAFMSAFLGHLPENL
jgi:hypothetical protein